MLIRKAILILIAVFLHMDFAFAGIDLTAKIDPKNDGFQGLVDGDQVLDESLTDAAILISDGTNYAAYVLSGDATMTNAGVVTVSGGTSKRFLEVMT
jgi:hypothetical protein